MDDLQSQHCNTVRGNQRRDFDTVNFVHKACTSVPFLILHRNGVGEIYHSLQQKLPCSKIIKLVIIAASQHIQLLKPTRCYLRLQLTTGLGGKHTLQCDSNWDNSSFLPHSSTVLKIKSIFKKNHNKKTKQTQTPQLKLTIGLYKINPLSCISSGFCLVSFCYDTQESLLPVSVHATDSLQPSFWNQ